MYTSSVQQHTRWSRRKNQWSGRHGSGTHPTEQQKEKRNLKSEDSLKDLWGNIKRNNIWIVGVPEGEERKKGAENVFEEIMAENVPNLVTETDI